MRRVKVYVEGASRGKGKNQSANIEFRKGFSQLAQKVGLANLPSFVPCAGRTKTWEVAWQSFLSRNREDLILLLVDSEEFIEHDPPDAWKHLRNRDGWTDLEVRHARFVFMMVTVMETWIVVDPGALATRFRTDYRADKIPKWQHPEAVAKGDVLSALEAATNGRYEKGEVSFELVGLLDPSTVAAKCPHARHFFEQLKVFCS